MCEYAALNLTITCNYNVPIQRKRKGKESILPLFSNLRLHWVSAGWTQKVSRRLREILCQAPRGLWRASCSFLFPQSLHSLLGITPRFPQSQSLSFSGRVWSPCESPMAYLLPYQFHKPLTVEHHFPLLLANSVTHCGQGDQNLISIIAHGSFEKSR